MDQVLQGLAFAHSKNLCHGNLRTDKIFIKDKLVKIIDFAGAIFVGSEGDASAKKLLNNWNNVYYPPDRLELLSPNLTKEEKMAILLSFDIYSFGMICYQLISRKSLKALETEAVLYKSNMTQYKEFSRILKELFEVYKGDKAFVYYFEPLLKVTLEFDRLKRPVVIEVHEKSKRNLRRVPRKKRREKEESKESEESDMEVYEEEEKALCYICMTDCTSTLKAIMECNHETCSKCLKHSIKKVVIDRSELVLEPFCYSCKSREKLKELYLNCKCPCNIEKARRSNKTKILNYDKGRLAFANCSNGHELTEDEAFMIFGNLKLSLRDEKISKEDVVSMGESLKRMQLIETVDLAQNQINCEGLEALVDILAGKEALRELSLDWNPFGPNGGKALEYLLENSNSLKALSVGKILLHVVDTCQLGFKGMQMLSKGLDKNKQLETLSIEWNQIGVEGAEALANAIKKHPSLKNLKLGLFRIISRVQHDKGSRCNSDSEGVGGECKIGEAEGRE
eukprot:TRINITY_DN11925_c0_g1_i2.p1 TRINITY_DN11925_c0_g1~~TRINITY_DN11925_c0_g1_i2.p1  ORF type:complete len:509 (+),score=109.99 TRINITY_DN11925_c0_g1_i2:92-1618(+)